MGGNQSRVEMGGVTHDLDGRKSIKSSNGRGYSRSGWEEINQELKWLLKIWMGGNQSRAEMGGGYSRSELGGDQSRAEMGRVT